jgi:hypothetical protein
MDQSWVQHVTAILDYLDGRTQSPNAQVLESARDLMGSLDAWAFFDSDSHYGLQVRTLDILQRLAYHDVDRGSISDIANWTLDRWLRILQRYPRSVPALRGEYQRCNIYRREVLINIRSGELVAFESPAMSC